MHLIQKVNCEKLDWVHLADDPEAYFANQALWTVGPEYWAMKFKSLASLPGRCPGSGLSRTFSISTFNGGPDYMGARTTSAIPKSIHQ